MIDCCKDAKDTCRRAIFRFKLQLNWGNLIEPIAVHASDDQRCDVHYVVMNVSLAGGPLLLTTKPRRPNVKTQSAELGMTSQWEDSVARWVPSAWRLFESRDEVVQQWMLEYPKSPFGISAKLIDRHSELALRHKRSRRLFGSHS